MPKKFLDDNGLLYVWTKIKTYVTNLVSTKQDKISDLSTIRSGAAKGATAVQTETDPVFSASAAAGITASDISNWNSKPSESGLVKKVKINGSEKTPDTSGVVDVGTVITDVSGKADKSATVSTVTYNTTSKKITKTINGTTSDVVTAAKIVTDGGGITDISGKVDKTTTVNGHALSGNVTVTKSDVSLGNVTNDAQVKRSEMGVANGVATLDNSGLVPSEQLPSYVDDVVEAWPVRINEPLSSNWLKDGPDDAVAITPASGKIYVLMEATDDYDANSQFRWGGTEYVKLNDGGVSVITNSEIDGIIV